MSAPHLAREIIGGLEIMAVFRDAAHGYVYDVRNIETGAVTMRTHADLEAMKTKPG